MHKRFAIAEVTTFKKGRDMRTVHSTGNDVPEGAVPLKDLYEALGPEADKKWQTRQEMVDMFGPLLGEALVPDRVCLLPTDNVTELVRRMRFPSGTVTTVYEERSLNGSASAHIARS